MGNDPFDIPIWTSGNQSVQGVDSCSQQPYYITGFYNTWWTGDTNIATANMSAMNGVGSGGTYDYAWGLINVGDGQSEIGHGNSCPQQWDQPSGDLGVNPTVSIQGSLGYVYIGHDPAAISKNAFFGSGNPGGGAYQWSSPDGSISFDNTQAATAHLTATSYSGGQNDTRINLSYTYNSRGASPASVLVTKRLFSYLSGDSVSLYASYSGPSTYGWIYYAYFQVYTHPDRALVSDGQYLSTYENVSVVSSNVSIQPFTESGSIGDDNKVKDKHQLTSNAPMPPGLSIVESQDIGVGGFYVRTNTITWSNTGANVQSLGPSN